jgi:hypothetical protein
MILDFDIYKFMERMLPIHKRQSNRMKLLWWTLRPLASLFTSFKSYREDAVFRANITGQLKSFVHYLNKYVEGANNGITIYEFVDGGQWVGIESENDEVWELGLSDEESESADFIYIAIEGEVDSQLAVDMVIQAPITANESDIHKFTQQFKLAGKTYEIEKH